jgi:hypothetical protein
MFKISQSKKEKGILCCAHSCNNKPIKRKAGLCHKHYARKMRELKPEKVRYSQMKQKAKSRNIPFSLTLDELEILCKNTGYLNKGKRGQNATVDRRCNFQGYHLFNLQIVHNRYNASKGNSHSGSNFERPDSLKSLDEIINESEASEEELPF